MLCLTFSHADKLILLLDLMNFYTALLPIEEQLNVTVFLLIISNFHLCYCRCCLFRFGFFHIWIQFCLCVSNSVSTIFWTYLLKMCKKPIEIDGFNSCLGKQGADARFGTYLAHSTQDTRYNASLFFSVEGSKKIRFYFFFCFIFLRY